MLPAISKFSMKNILLSIWIIVSLTSAAGLEYRTITDYEANNEKAVEEERNEDEKSDESQQLLQIDKALSNTVSVPLHADLKREFEFPEIKSIQQKIHRACNVSQSEFHRVLFRSIISPNAP